MIAHRAGQTTLPCGPEPVEHQGEAGRESTMKPDTVTAPPRAAAVPRGAWVLAVDVDPYVGFLLQRELGGSRIVTVTRLGDLDAELRDGPAPAYILTVAARADSVMRWAPDVPLIVVGVSEARPTAAAWSQLRPPFTASSVRRALADVSAGRVGPVRLRTETSRSVPPALCHLGAALADATSERFSTLRLVAGQVLTGALASRPIQAAAVHLDEAGGLFEVASSGLPPGHPAWFGTASPAGHLVAPGQVVRMPTAELVEPACRRPTLDWYATALADGDEVHGLVLAGLPVGTDDREHRAHVRALGRELARGMSVLWQVAAGIPASAYDGAGGPAVDMPAWSRRDLGSALGEYARQVSLLTGQRFRVVAEGRIADATVAGVLFRAARALVDLVLHREGVAVVVEAAPGGGLVRVTGGAPQRPGRRDQQAVLASVRAELATIGADLVAVPGDGHAWEAEIRWSSPTRRTSGRQAVTR